MLNNKSKSVSFLLRFCFVVLVVGMFFSVGVRGQIKRKICVTIIDKRREAINETNYDNFTFITDVAFYSDTFLRDTYFNLDTFQNKSVFTNSTFKEGADFDGSTFQKDAGFDGSTFQKDAGFDSSTFQEDADFYESTFQNWAYFEYSTFQNWAYFEYSTFQNRADFEYSTFQNRADFVSSTFQNRADFVSSTFQKRADFTGVHFKDEVDFKGVYFLDTIIFNLVTDVAKRIDFTYCLTDTVRKLHPPTIRYINLSNTDISKIKIDYLHFRLCFDKGVSFEQKSLIYNSLLNNFKNDGFADSYEILDKEFKDTVYNHKIGAGFTFFKGKIKIPNIFSPYFWLKYIDRWWWDYGYYKGSVFLWIIGSLFVFTIFTRLYYRHITGVYYIENIHPKVDNPVTGHKVEIEYHKLSFFEKWYVAFLYTAIIFFSLNIKINKMNWRPKRYAAYLMLVYTFGLLCLGYTVNFVLQK